MNSESKIVVQKAEELGEFILDVDGSVYWWPHGSKYGYLTSHQLRALADELDARNKAWDDQVAKDLERLAHGSLRSESESV